MAEKQHSDTRRKLVSLQELKRDLQSVTSWKEMGYLLRVSKATIDRIEEENSDDEQCRNKLLDYWMMNSSNGTWDEIIRAVVRLGNTDLASKLRKKIYDEPQDDESGGKRIETFTSLVNNFTLLVMRAKELFRNGELESVKIRLIKMFPETESELSSYHSYDELFAYLRMNYLNEFNTYALEAVTCFLPDEFKDENRKFLEARQAFYQSVSVYQFEEAFTCYREIKCSKFMTAFEIKLLFVEAKKITMEELQGLVNSAFKKQVKYLGEVVAARGCISVSWLISESVILEMQQTAENYKFPDWVEQVKIGNIVVFPKEIELGDQEAQCDETRPVRRHETTQLEEEFAKQAIKLGETTKELADTNVKLEETEEKLRQAEVLLKQNEQPKTKASQTIMDIPQEWKILKEKLSDALEKFSAIAEDCKDSISKSARICKELNRPRPVLLIPVTGPKKSGKTFLVNAMLGGSVVHRKRSFSIYVEHVPDRHLHCEATEPCHLCVRLVTSTGQELAKGRRNVLFKQEQLEMPNIDEHYIIQTKIPMLENVPNDFPFTVYLADCPGDKIARFTKDFELSAVLVPAVVCAVSTSDYKNRPVETLQSTEQALGVTSMVNHGLAEARVVFAATFCENVMYSGDARASSEESLRRMKEDLVNCTKDSSRFYAVADKWARKTRHFIEDPDRQGLLEHVQDAWQWVRSQKEVPKWINPDKIVELAIGHFENGIKQSFTKKYLNKWVKHLCDQADSMLDDEEVLDHEKVLDHENHAPILANRQGSHPSLETV